jgi:hypothetical protein
MRRRTMPGRPKSRAQQMIRAAGARVMAGEPEAARVLIEEARKVCREGGIEMPNVPADVSDLLMRVEQAHASRPGTGGTLSPRAAEMRERAKSLQMPEDVRQRLMAAGDLALEHLEALLTDEAVWSRGSSVPIRDRLSIIDMAQRRAWGVMHSGAQRVVASGKEGGLSGRIGQTLESLIEAKRAGRDGQADVEGGGEAEE